jgi:hypothetical protein
MFVPMWQATHRIEDRYLQDPRVKAINKVTSLGLIAKSYAMKTYGERRYRSTIFNLDTGWSGQFHAAAALPPEKRLSMLFV